MSSSPKPWWQVSVPKDVSYDDDDDDYEYDEELVFTNFTFREEDDVMLNNNGVNKDSEQSKTRVKNAINTEPNGKDEFDNLCTALDGAIQLYSSYSEHNGNSRQELLRSMSWQDNDDDDDDDEVRYLIF